jgi:hypothetical protein
MPEVGLKVLRVSDATGADGVGVVDVGAGWASEGFEGFEGRGKWYFVVIRVCICSS